MNNPIVFSVLGVAVGLVAAAVTAFVTYQRNQDHLNNSRNDRGTRISGRTSRKCDMCGHYIIENVHPVFKGACGKLLHQGCVSDKIRREIPESRNHILFSEVGFRYHKFKCVCENEHAVRYRVMRKECSIPTCFESNNSVPFITSECNHNFHSTCLVSNILKGNIKCPKRLCGNDLTEKCFMKAFANCDHEFEFLYNLFFLPKSSKNVSIDHYCDWCKEYISRVQYLRCGHYVHAKCFIGYYCFSVVTKKIACCPACSEPIRPILGVEGASDYGSGNTKSSRGTAAYDSDNIRRESISERKTNQRKITKIESCRYCQKSYLPVYLDCDHYYHSMCIMAKILIKIVEHKSPVCPEEGCGKTISESKLNEIVIAVDEDKKGERKPGSLNMDPDGPRTSCSVPYNINYEKSDFGKTTQNACKDTMVNTESTCSSIYSRKNALKRESIPSTSGYPNNINYEKSDVGKTTQNACKDTMVNTEATCSSIYNRKNALKRESIPSTSGIYVTKYEKAKNLSRGSPEIELTANCSSSVIHDSPLISKITLSVSGNVPCQRCTSKNLPGELVLPCNHKFHPCVETVQALVQKRNCLQKNCESKFNSTDNTFLMELLLKRLAKREKNSRRRSKKGNKQN